MKSNVLKILTMSIALSFMIGCSKNETKNVTDEGTKIPEKLELPQSSVSKKPSKVTIAQLKDKYGKAPKMTLPDFDLVMPPSNETEEEAYIRVAREMELKKRDINAYNLMLDLRANCAKKHNKATVDATFPDNAKSTRDLEAGDSVKAKFSAGLKGNQCPIIGSTGYYGEAEVTSKDSEKIGGKAGAGFNFDARIQSQKYAELLNTRGLVVNYDISGMTIARHVEKGQNDNDGTEKGYAKFGVAGQYYTAKDAIDFTLKIEILVNQKTNQKEQIILAKFNFPETPIEVAAKLKVNTDGTATPETVTLNGNPSSAQEIQDILGTNNPVTQPETWVPQNP